MPIPFFGHVYLGGSWHLIFQISKLSVFHTVTGPFENIFFFFFVFCLFVVVVVVAISWAAPAAYGGSQVRGRIRPVAAGYARATATRDPSRVCNLHHSSRQRQI